MWILSYDVEENGKTTRGFFIVYDAIEAHIRFELSQRQEPDRNYKLEEAHHFEMARRMGKDEEATFWDAAIAQGVPCQDIILQWKDYR